MADVQLEKGYTKIANKILEQMAMIKLSATQYRIVMVVWRYTYGFDRKMHELSISFICKATGCSDRQIQREIKDLVARNILIQKSQQGKSSLLGFNKDFDQWVEEKVVKQPTPDKSVGGDKIDVPGITPDNLDRGLPTNLSGVPPSNLSPKKESITEKLKEKDLDDDKGVPTSKSSEGQEKGIVPTSMSFPEQTEPQTPFNQIRAHYLGLRDYGFEITHKDAMCIQQVLDSGVPTSTVLEGTSLAFDRFKPEHPTHRINSFSYCKPVIEELHYKKTNAERSKQHGATGKSLGSSLEEGERIQKHGGHPSGTGNPSITKGRTGRLRRPTYL